MNKTVCLLIPATLLALAACNRSAQEPSADVLASQVAATLTAAPTLPPSLTPLPSQTPIPRATDTLEPSPTISETPTEGTGPTSTPLPLAPDDPRTGLNLSVPDYKDGFSVPYKWIGPNDSASATNLVDNGKLVAVDHKADHFIWWSTTDQKAGDVYVEVTAAIGACSGKDAAGLALRVGGENFDQGYALEVSCDGFFRVRKFINVATPPTTLIDWTAGPDINKGPNASNRIGFLAKDGHLYIFANNKLEGQKEDNAFASGTFGLYASAETTPDLTVTFTDFALWYPQP
jgi:hypothetical protein